MKNKRQLSLRSKLLLLLLVPLLALVCLAQFELRLLSKQKTEATNFIDLAELGVVASRLIHEVQKERGFTAGYLGSKGGRFGEALITQRKETDARLSELRMYLANFDQDKFGPTLSAGLNASLSDLEELAAKRKDISSQSTALGAAIGYYTGVNRKFINLIAALPKLTEFGSLSSSASAYLAFIQSKERAGIERAVLASAFSADRFQDRLYQRFHTLVVEQDTFLHVFLSLATDEQKSYLSSTLAGKSVEEAARLREVANDKAVAGSFDVDPTYWFKVQTDKINLLKNIEDKLSADLRAEAGEVQSTANDLLMFTIALVVACFVLCIVVGGLIMRRVMSQLGAEPLRLNEVANNIANGDLEHPVKCKNPDSTLGMMAIMQEKIKERNNEKETISRIFRLQAGMAKLSVPVLVANESGTITYVNDAMIAYFERYRMQLIEICAKFNSGELKGRSVFDFSRDSAKFKRFFDTAQEGYATELTFGDRIASLHVIQTFDHDGAHVGYALELNDITTDRVVMSEVDQVVSAANRGELTTRVTLDDKQGVYAQLSTSINALLDVTCSVTTDLKQFLSAIAAGDLSRTIESELEGDFAVLKSDANRSVLKLNEVMQKVRVIAQNVDVAAREINAGNLDLSSRTESTAASLEETSSSMEEMTASVAQTAENATRANDLVVNAREKAEEGGVIVGRAVEAMSGINQSSQKISDIIGVIDEIAFQTNLLALNASVEAARAGEQGRGFAAVASEVRNLAGRSAVAAKEIKELIEDSVSRVQNGTELVGQSGTTLQEIIDQVLKVADVVAEISASSNEQSEGIVMVGGAINQIDEATQQNAALVEEATAASQSTSSQAEQLLREVEFFRQTQPSDDDSIQNWKAA